MSKESKENEVRPELDDKQMEEAKKIINALMKQTEDNKANSDSYQNGFRTGFIKGFEEGLTAMKFVYAEISNELQNTMDKINIVEPDTTKPSGTDVGKSNQNFYN